MLRKATITVVFAVLAGCTIGIKKPYVADAFGKEKTFAVVTILSDPQIRLLGDSMQSDAGLLKSMTSSKYSGPSAIILEETKPTILQTLGGTGVFQLVPEARVLSSPAYAAVKGAEKLTVVPAQGYKAITGTQETAALARELGANAALQLQVNYGYGMHGVNAFGLVSAGKVHGRVQISVDAIAPDGKTIWKDTVEGESKDGIPAVGEVVDVKELQPFLKEAAESAARKLVAILPKAS